MHIPNNFQSENIPDMEEYGTNSSPEEKEKLKKRKTSTFSSVTFSSDNVEFRIHDHEGTNQHEDTTGGARVQILASIILNILALSTGASYGVPNVLMAKLDAYGFSEEALIYINSYLKNRKQRTKVSGEFSSWQEINMVFHKAQFLGHSCLTSS